MIELPIEISTILLGIIQGLTEFLPISSSGHLFIADAMLVSDFPLAFDILLHSATLLAVLVFTFPLIKCMVLAITDSIVSALPFPSKMPHDAHKSSMDTQERKQIVKLFINICISTLCTAPIAILLRNIVTNANIQLVGIALLVTAIILLLPSVASHNALPLKKHHTATAVPSVTVFQAVILGMIQGFAVLPGISRSGTTIAIGILTGLSFVHAAQYSFLLAIPTILASLIFTFTDLSAITTIVPWYILILSMAITFICGLLGLIWISALVKNKKLWYFSLYLIIVGCIVLFVLPNVLPQ